MAYAATMTFQRSMRASRFTEALNAFFPSDKNKSTTLRTQSIGKDIVELSPYNEIRRTISQFRKQISTESELNVSLTLPSDEIENSGESKGFQLDKDLDMMLHMVSKDDEDYRRMKAEFKKLYSETVSAHSQKSQQVRSPEIGKQSSISIAQDSMRQSSSRIDVKFKQGKSRELTPSEMGIIEVDPLVLDIAGDGLNLTKAGEGGFFDINADGKVDNTAWVQGDDAMLVYDKNGNGIIDNGKELFGDQNGSKDGFAELAKYDANKDGKISFLDPIYKALKLYQDINADGKIEKNELKSLDEMGIKSLSLNFVKNSAKLNGNSMLLSGSFEKNDGTIGHLADVMLGYKK